MNRNIKLRKRRAVSETIGTILIIAVTVVGAVFISNAMQNVAFPFSSGSETFGTKATARDRRGNSARARHEFATSPVGW